jgi:hypothetical protein
MVSTFLAITSTPQGVVFVLSLFCMTQECGGLTAKNPEHSLIDFFVS